MKKLNLKIRSNILSLQKYKKRFSSFAISPNIGLNSWCNIIHEFNIAISKSNKEITIWKQNLKLIKTNKINLKLINLYLLKISF